MTCWLNYPYKVASSNLLIDLIDPSFEAVDMADGNEQGKWVNLDENS